MKSSNILPSGNYTTIAGEKFYQIENFDRMNPFFISLASDTDLWMYVSSTGGLSCGRRSPDQALFPYYTDDKLTDNYRSTGPRTLLRVTLSDEEGQREVQWEPFSENTECLWHTTRRIMKSVVGNSLIFEEANTDLQLVFRYRWQACDQYGWVRRVEICNEGNAPVEVEYLDGLQNILPAGVNRSSQNTYSTLVDGYKKVEQVEGTHLLLFRMEAIMVDRAEPSESLRCNTIYGLGMEGTELLCSSQQVEAFRRGLPIVGETESKGVRSAFFVHGRTALLPGGQKRWYMVADVEKDASDVCALIQLLNDNRHLIIDVEEALMASTEALRAIVAQNDGVQLTGDPAQDARHFANVLFNTMRGGYYLDSYTIDTRAFAQHVKLFNKPLYAEVESFLTSLPEKLQYQELNGQIVHCQVVHKEQLLRLFFEYLPLTFSRRHGDPSRPWNTFDIRVKDEAGNPIIAYQGNWRDIFQNWEALSASYPGYVNGIIAKFLNATTADGYNPYRVTSEGFDWETINPDDPWSNIGYWGDHQTIYLCKLLEMSMQHDPEALRDMLNKRIFAFANVPYRFKSYADIVRDPKNSIVFDDATHQAALALAKEIGSDGKLLHGEGEIRMTTMVDKLLITFLTKLSNFVPDAGIWMNTLRPEWNDANNALVGQGASMVTLCYLNRLVKVVLSVLESQEGTFTIGRETAAFLQAVMAQVAPLAATPKALSDTQRRAFVDAMGMAGEAYRNAVYAGLSGEKVHISAADLRKALEAASKLMTYYIHAGKREDGLYNAYNLISFDGEDKLSVQQLYEMLEGQVAVLSSKALSPEEAADLLETMRHSALYREDQRSYMLYPNRRRPSFLEMNNIPADAFTAEEQAELLAADCIRRDCNGGLHFNPAFRNVGMMEEYMQRTPCPCWGKGTGDRSRSVYESVFNHHAFTGRSGTFYKYEGLGSIYWHMVSKLLLAISEQIEAEKTKTQTTTQTLDVSEPSILERLKAAYRSVKEGLGSHKQPAEYGSFPFDPYSHTPSMSGVQQPGMTGQVKEDILCRWFELGLVVKNGIITINPYMLTPDDFADGELRFTYCGTPFVYRLGDQTNPSMLDAETSAHIFARDGKVKEVVVTVAIEN